MSQPESRKGMRRHRRDGVKSCLCGSRVSRARCVSSRYHVRSEGREGEAQVYRPHKNWKLSQGIGMSRKGPAVREAVPTNAPPPTDHDVAANKAILRGLRQACCVHKEDAPTRPTRHPSRIKISVSSTNLGASFLVWLGQAPNWRGRRRPWGRLREQAGPERLRRGGGTP